MTAPPAPPEALRQRGYAVLRGIYDAADRAHLAHRLDALVAAVDRPADAWGVEVVPLLERAPDLAPYLDRPSLVEGVSAALGAPARRLYDGARFTGRGQGGFLPWHFHADLAGGDGRWDPARPGAPPRVERVVVTAYLDGATPETGPLWVLPRAEGDPWRPPLADPGVPWPGQVELHLDPGDVAIWDVATFHAAWCRRGPRRIFGGIYGRADAPTP